MAVLLTLGTFAGSLLGLRFKPLVLCPAVIVAATGMAGVSIAHGNPMGSIAFHIGLVAVALQMEYVGGCIFRLPLPATERPHRPRSAPLGY
jgi:hypothetical protein